MREKEGKQNYTAMDYMQERFGLRNGGKYTEKGKALQQAVRAGLNLDEQVHVVDLDVLTNDLKGKSNKEIIAYISKLSRTEPIPVADFKALVGLPKDNDRYGQRHLIRGKANQSAANRAARNTVLSNFRDVVQHAVVVEVVPNTKKKSLHGLQGAKWRTQKRKNEVENYYRLMVPVRINGRIRTLVIVAEERNGVVLSPTSVKVYEIYYAKKHPLATAPITETSSKAGAKAGVSVAEEDALSTISIRDMLTGVKDADGNLYVQPKKIETLEQSAWHGTGARFLLSLIGIGEGNQAYGWGLYFAQDRDTAEEYRYKLSSGGDGLIYYGETYEHINYVWTLVGDSNDAGGYIENDTGEAKALDEFYSFGNAEEAIASLQGELDEMREGLSDEELEELEADEDYQKIQILHHRIMRMTLWLWVKKKMLTKLTYI